MLMADNRLSGMPRKQSNSLACCSYIIGNTLVVEHVPQVPRLRLAAALPALRAPLTATSLLLARHPLALFLLAALPVRRGIGAKLIGPICIHHASSSYLRSVLGFAQV